MSAKGGARMLYRIARSENTGFELQFYFQNSPETDKKHDFPAHIHDSLEVYLLVEGDVSFLVEGHLYRLRPGDAVVSKPNEVHNCILNSDTLHRHFCFWFDTTAPFFFDRFLQYAPGEGNLISPENDAVRATILQTAQNLFEAASEGAEPLWQYAKAVELLALWQRNLTDEPKGETLPAELQTILRDIEENLPHIHRLGYFTEKYYISASTLARLFRRYLGISPKTYLENKRLARSRTLMCGGASVTAACAAAGFGDLADFIRLFRRRFGITPAVYRREGDLAGALSSNQYKTKLPQQ